MKLNHVIKENNTKTIDHNIGNHGSWIRDTKGFDNSIIFSVIGSVNFSAEAVEILLDKQFGKVTGDFLIDNNNLLNLKNCPTQVDGHFDCSYNNLRDLVDSPKKVEGAFNCSYNRLTTLKGAPKIIGQSFNCQDNDLTSLDYCPEIVFHNFNISNNPIVSLKGCPKEINNNFLANSCKLESLDFAIEKCRAFSVYNNQIKSLVGIHKIIKHCKRLDVSINPITSGGLGILLIPGIEEVLADDINAPDGGFTVALKIIKRYLGQGKAGLLDCQEELIDAGLERFAKL